MWGGEAKNNGKVKKKENHSTRVKKRGRGAVPPFTSAYMILAPARSKHTQQFVFKFIYMYRIASYCRVQGSYITCPIKREHYPHIYSL